MCYLTCLIKNYLYLSVFTEVLYVVYKKGWLKLMNCVYGVPFIVPYNINYFIPLTWGSI